MPDNKALVILASYCAVARPAMRNWMAANSCISATGVTCHTLAALGYSVRPVAVRFAVELPTLEVCYTAGCTDEELAGAKSVSPMSPHIDFSPGGWDGHLVAIVSDRYIIDSAFDQADVGFGGVLGLVDAPECMLFPLEREVQAGHHFKVDIEGAFGSVPARIQYASSDDETWRTSEAWTDPALHLIAAAILEQMGVENNSLLVHFLLDTLSG